MNFQIAPILYDWDNPNQRLTFDGEFQMKVFRGKELKQCVCRDT